MMAIYPYTDRPHPPTTHGAHTRTASSTHHPPTTTHTQSLIHPPPTHHGARAHTHTQVPSVLTPVQIPASESPDNVATLIVDTAADAPLERLVARIKASFWYIYVCVCFGMCVCIFLSS